MGYPGFAWLDERTFAWAVTAWLAFLTVLRFTAGRRWPEVFEASRSRLGWWWCLAAFAALSVFLGKVPLVLGLAALSFLALKEFFTIVPSRRADRPAILLAYLSVPFALAYVYVEWYSMFILSVPVYVFLALPVALALQEDKNGMTLSLGRIAFGILLLCYCPAHAGYLFVLSPRWFASILLLSEVADHAQLALSRLLPVPDPVLEGAVGLGKNRWGVLLSVGLTVPLCLALGKFNSWPLVHCLGLGVLIPVLSLIGDLVFYSVRADLGVAGPRPLVPGRGLILDRLRALCYVAPLAFHYLRYFLL